MVFDRVIVRCELYPDEVSSSFKFVQVNTAKTPGMYAGAQVEFQFALFKKKATPSADAELYDIAQFSGLPKMRIRNLTSAGIVLLDETVASAIEKDVTLDLASWQDGSRQHFRFSFPETATGIATGTHFIVIYGPDGDVFGISSIEVIDPGTGASNSPTPSADGYYTKTEARGLLADKLDKQFAEDQPLVFYARNTTTNQLGRITLQPIFDDGGLRLVPMPEPL